MAEQGSAGPSVVPLDRQRPQPHALITRIGEALFSRSTDRHANQAELLRILHYVADAVSSVVEVDGVTELVVDSAKRITGTDKAIVVLLDEVVGGIDTETLAVRGRRDQHEQEWWENRLEEISGRVDIELEPIVEKHPDHDAWLLCCPIVVRGIAVGLLCAVNDSARPFTQLQKDSLAILSAFAASSIENARLAEQSRYAYLASERGRIAREMHDGVVQSLFSISLGMEVCKKQIHRDPAGVADRLDDLQMHLNSAMTELRRFIYDLRPVKLAELGLVGAVEFWLNEITMGRAIKGKFMLGDPLPRLNPVEEAVLYGAAKEAVSNAVRHASARTVTVRIDGAPDAVTLKVIDDGEGFDVRNPASRPSGGIGLNSIRHRVEAEGGTIEIESSQGFGTQVIIRLPVSGGKR